MNDDDRSLDAEALRALREGYNEPPETPREEMWRVVRAGLPGPKGGEEPEVVDLFSRRSSRWRGRTALRWAVAAAAVMVLGVGIGRMTSPRSGGSDGAGGTSVGIASPQVADLPLRIATVEHLEGTEALLTQVRSDARSGELDPRMRTLARGLLTQTRLFLDVSEGADPKLLSLMEDLELVLAQIVTVTEGGARERTELDLALEGLDDREVLPRIRTLSGTRMVDE